MWLVISFCSFRYFCDFSSCSWMLLLHLMMMMIMNCWCFARKKMLVLKKRSQNQAQSLKSQKLKQTESTCDNNTLPFLEFFCSTFTQSRAQGVWKLKGPSWLCLCWFFGIFFVLLLLLCIIIHCPSDWLLRCFCWVASNYSHAEMLSRRWRASAAFLLC